MDLVSLATSVLVLQLTVISAAIPINVQKPTNQTVITSEPEAAHEDTTADNKPVYESHPNPPVPTPPTLAYKIKTNIPSNRPVNDGGKNKWGFGDKYLASQNKAAFRRNVMFDVVAGDAMSFSNYNVLGHQEASLPKK